MADLKSQSRPQPGIIMGRCVKAGVDASGRPCLVIRPWPGHDGMVEGLLWRDCIVQPAPAVRSMPAPAGWSPDEWTLAIESARRLPKPKALTEREIAGLHQKKRRKVETKP
jgi:hypothetical protein